ncbi:hypothetical protein DPMN_132854 [Dreissena polymorpha]|uniref:Uncharacterized protein n=1 Tax=Dreissena polymorpha TaxID=45954 RepID=A0A9D4FU56_DREPO|nr:hypothetical protein DPMN_132854 [Dreissena polymorpha]
MWRRLWRTIPGSFNRTDQPDRDIWVIGDSIPYWAGIRALQTGKSDLKIPDHKQIGWWGMRGMTWALFRHAANFQIADLSGLVVTTSCMETCQEHEEKIKSVLTGSSSANIYAALHTFVYTDDALI